MSVVVVSDLDGTLLDHHDYSFDAARPALDKLAEAGIAIVLNTSKTFAETRTWLNKLALTTPCAVENGAAIYAPDGQLIKAFGTPRREILAWLDHHRQKNNWNLRSFHDMSRAQLQDCTGLSAQQAEQAQARDWSEPLHWAGNDNQLQKFQQTAALAGLQLIRGGRFWSLQGKHDKAQLIPALGEILQCDGPIQTVALGDGENDASMLAAANLAIWIRSPSHELPAHCLCPDQRTSEKVGPAGWNDSIMQLFEQGFFDHE